MQVDGEMKVFQDEEKLMGSNQHFRRKWKGPHTVKGDKWSKHKSSEKVSTLGVKDERLN